MSSRLRFAALLPLACATLVAAQDHQAPSAYRITLTSSLYGEPQIVTIARSGSKALVDEVSTEKTAHTSIHSRTLYDLDANTVTSWAWPNPPACYTSAFAGDWGDPFIAAAALTGPDAKLADIQTVNGMTVNVMTAPAPDRNSYKVWIDSRTGLMLRAHLIPADNGPERPLLDVTEISLTAPPADTFALPAACAPSAEPPTADQQIAALTGNDPAFFQNALIGPASAETCAVNFRIVQAGSLTPITAGFQAAVDLTVDPKNLPHYIVGQDPDGHVEFGGGLHEVTASFKGGALRLEHPPAQFEIDAEFGNAGAGHALLFRQCTGPESTLLFVVRNPARLSDGGLWLWLKPGKPAKPAKSAKPAPAKADSAKPAAPAPAATAPAPAPAAPAAKPQ